MMDDISCKSEHLNSGLRVIIICWFAQRYDNNDFLFALEAGEQMASGKLVLMR